MNTLDKTILNLTRMAGCEKLPEALRENCEAKKDSGSDKEAGEDLDGLIADLELMAEGCPDNLDSSECAEWEANTEKYQDVVKDQHKTAGMSVLDYIIDPRSFSVLDDVLDEQTYDLAYEVYADLQRELSLGGNKQEALRRLKASVDAGRKWDAAMHRNNIFKAANLMGMRLPSAMFASQAKVGSGRANAKYLDSLPSSQKTKILNTMARHYGISTAEAYLELIDRDAEPLYEYIANNRPLANQVYREFKLMKLAKNAGCDKLPEGPMRDNCEGKKKDKEASSFQIGDKVQFSPRVVRRMTIDQEVGAAMVGEITGADNVTGWWWVNWTGAPSGFPKPYITREKEKDLIPAKRGRRAVDLDETFERLARFEKGVSVDVPEYLREHGNPEAADAWVEMNEEHKDNFKSAKDNDGKGKGKDDHDFASEVPNGEGKTAAVAPGGLYGFPKSIQAACESAGRKLAKAARTLAKTAYRKDERVAEFMGTHAKRSKSVAAKALVAALNELGPRIASEDEDDKAKKEAGKASYGLYGYPDKVSSLGLATCSSLMEEAGRVAADLHRRKADHHQRILGFLGEHCKQAKCLYSRLILDAYPDATLRLASMTPSSVDEWLKWADDEDDENDEG